MSEKKSHYKKYLISPTIDVPRTTLRRVQKEMPNVPSTVNSEKDVVSSSSKCENKKKIDTNSTIIAELFLNDGATAMEVDLFDQCNSLYWKLDNPTSDEEDFDSIAVQSTICHVIADDFENTEEHLIVKNIPDMVNIEELEEIDELERTTDPLIDNLFEEKKNNETSSTPFKKLLKLINSQEFSESIDENVDKTKGEVLMILLKYAIAHCLSQTAVSDLFMLVNSLFPYPILPDSRFLIDSLFNPANNATFHGICPECGSYIGIFQSSFKIVKCNTCNIDVDVQNLSYNDFFVFFNVENQISELIESHSEYYSYVMNERISDPNVLKDIYDGKMYQEFRNTLCEEEKHQYITTMFNTDGAPLYKSSSYSIWPIFLQIYELPFNVRTNDLIVCGLWFGKVKPVMDVFLHPFVQNMNELYKQGVPCKINGKKVSIKLYTLTCCVDSVARAPIQGMSQFNGEYGCPWCLHPGKWVLHPSHPNSGSYKYPLCDVAISKRNVKDSISHMEKGTPSKPCFGFKTASKLVNLEKFNIIEGQIPDHLHIFSGIGKFFSNIWFGSKKETCSMVKKEQLEELNVIMEKIKVPCQIGRLTRSLKDKEFWKAREWENWIIYYSLPIISLVLEKKYVSHWILFVEGVYILLKDNITLTELDRADKLLHKFVADTEKLYSATAMTYNVHLLLHLGKSVLNWGPLFAHSTYGFESGNGKLLKIIYAAKGVHRQVARHIGLNFSHLAIKGAVYEKSSLQMKDYYDKLGSTKVKNTFKLSRQRYFGSITKVDDTWITYLNLSNTALSFSKMIKDKCLYLSSEKINKRSDNSVVLLSDGSYGSIIKFIVDRERNQEFVILKLLTTKCAFASKNHKIFQQVIKVDSQMSAKPIRDIMKVSVSFDILNDWFICAVPNLLSY